MMAEQVGRLLQIRPLLASIAVALFPDPRQVGLQRLFKLSSRQPPLAKYTNTGGSVTRIYQL